MHDLEVRQICELVFDATESDTCVNVITEDIAKTGIICDTVATSYYIVATSYYYCTQLR